MHHHRRPAVYSTLIGSTQPSLAFDFTNGAPDSRITAVRAAGGATYTDINGNLQLAAQDSQRMDCTPVRQQLANTVAYTAGGGSTNTVSTEAPVLFPGTAVIKNVMTQSGVNTNCMASSMTPPIITPITASIYVWLPSQWTGTSVALSIEGTGTGTPQTQTNNTLRDQWQRIAVTTATSASSGVTNIVLRVTSANGQFIFYTGIQMEYGSVATGYQPAISSVVTTEGVGLLCEEGKTNSIRNPRCEGAVAATPGTPPTNWSGWGNNSGLTQQIVGTGSEAGIPYIDVRYSGTTNTTGFFPAFEASTQIAALTAQTWTLSAYFRIVGGTSTNLGGISLGWQELTSGGAFVVSQGNAGVLPTAAPLATQRQSFTFTNNGGATTAFVYPTFGILFASGVSVDFTLRIGAPQMELSDCSTSVILPAIGTPAATARVGDGYSIPIGPWYNTQVGTLYAACIYEAVGISSNHALVQLDNGPTITDIIHIWMQATASNIFGQLKAAGVANAPRNRAVTANTPSNAAISWDGVNMQFASGGVAATSASPSATPTGIIRMLIGRDHPTAGTWCTNGRLTAVKYFPRAMSVGELAQLTSTV